MKISTVISDQAKVGLKLKLRLWDQVGKRSNRELRKHCIDNKVPVFFLVGLPLLIQSEVPFSNISAKEFPSNLSLINERVLECHFALEGVARLGQGCLFIMILQIRQ